MAHQTAAKSKEIQVSYTILKLSCKTDFLLHSFKGVPQGAI